MDANSLKSLLRSNEWHAHAFSCLREISYLVASDEALARDLLIRALATQEGLDESTLAILDGLSERLGLLPYCHPTSLGVSSQIRYEMHRVGDIVLHAAQAKAFWRLVDGQSLVLSAPTSFGKSLLIDLLIESTSFGNVLVVVPTIALIDETRKRLTAKFRERFKVITQLGQKPAARNIFVFTQERALEYRPEPAIDLLVIDEFYKLHPTPGAEERAYLLNEAFYRYQRKARQFYLLGPSVRGMLDAVETALDCHVTVSEFRTVATDVHRVEAEGSRYGELRSLLSRLTEQTIVYFKSPGSLKKALSVVLESSRARTEVSAEATLFAEWIGREYGAGWQVAKAVAAGIGVHHGRLPRAAAQHMVRLFNRGTLRFLFCTSTLIEGVNTSAKNVVVFDNKVAMKKFDFFTYSNIVGRSGRMREHFVGNVYQFDATPESALPQIDVPVLSQGPDIPDELLLSLDPADLTNESQRRVSSVLAQDVLSVDTIVANRGFEPQAQLLLAEQVRTSVAASLELVAWTGFPTYRQLEWVCERMWLLLQSRSRHVGHGVITPAQLAFKIWNLARRGVDGMLTDARGDDGEVENILDFLRYWAGHHFPRALMALSRIQAEVLLSLGHHPGDYSFYAELAENWFLEPYVLAMEEFGLPYQVARKVLAGDEYEDIDEALRRVRDFDAHESELAPFEIDLLAETAAGL